MKDSYSSKLSEYAQKELLHKREASVIKSLGQELAANSISIASMIGAKVITSSCIEVGKHGSTKDAIEHGKTMLLAFLNTGKVVPNIQKQYDPNYKQNHKK